MDNSAAMSKGRKEFTMMWFIENYSYCGHKKGEPLVSPIFTTDSFESTRWNLQLYPRGSSNANEGHISLYLMRHDKSKFFPQKFEMAVLAADGKSALHSKEWECVKEPEFPCGESEFLRINEVLLQQKATYLYQDTLIIRCKLWNEKESNLIVGQCSARTRIGTEKISFLHSVIDFSYLKQKEIKTIQVKTHSESECIISSSLYFSDVWSIEGTFLTMETMPSNNKYVFLKHTISLLNQSGNLVECCVADSRSEDKIINIQKVHLSLTKEEILERKGEYLPNDVLSLICECTFATGVQFEKIEEVQHGIPLPSLKECYCYPSNKAGYNAEKLYTCTSALDDLKTLYKKQHLTDVELKTKTKSFPAHKLVLCARSSVFNAILTSDMKEKINNCVHLDDLDNDTVQQLLLFLYSDDLENLQWETAIKLYYAGDKYDLEKLKVLCSSFLVDHLSSSTASELLLLADTHNDCNLKKTVEDFILKHEEEIFQSEEWSKLIEKNPFLVSQTMCLKYKRKK